MSGNVLDTSSEIGGSLATSWHKWICVRHIPLYENCGLRHYLQDRLPDIIDSIKHWHGSKKQICVEVLYFMLFNLKNGCMPCSRLNFFMKIKVKLHTRQQQYKYNWVFRLQVAPFTATIIWLLLWFNSSTLLESCYRLSILIGMRFHPLILFNLW
jgi:hypothetical protein